jgi:hypothetical protein
MDPATQFGERNAAGSGDHATGDFKDGRLRRKIVAGLVRLLLPTIAERGAPIDQEIFRALFD